MKLLGLVLLLLLFYSPVTCWAGLEEDGDHLTITGDSVYTINDHDDAFREYTVRDSGRLVIRDVFDEIYASGEYLRLSIYTNVHAYDDAVIEVYDSRLPAMVNLYNRSRAQVSNSSLIFYSSCPTHGYHVGGGVKLNDWATASIKGSTVGGLLALDDSSVEVFDSTIEDILSGTLDSRGQILLSDSRVHRIWFNPSNVTLVENLRNEALSNWDSSTVFPGGKIVFDNTELVNGTWLSLEGDEYVVRNSDFYGLSIGHSTASTVEGSDLWYLGFTSSRGLMRVIDSSMSYLSVYQCTGGRVVVDGCIIEELRYEWSTAGLEVINSSIGVFRVEDLLQNDTVVSHRFTGSTVRDLALESRASWTLSYLFEDTEVEALRLPHTGKTRIAGGLRVLNETVPLFLDMNHDFYLSRGYPVLVTRGGEPVSNATLVLSNGNVTLWTGVTDGNGSASVDVLFRNMYQINDLVVNPDLPRIVRFDNLTDTLTLTVEAHGQVIDTPLTAMSDTPIIVDYSSSRRGDDLFVFGLIAVIVFLVLRKG